MAGGDAYKFSWPIEHLHVFFVDFRTHRAYHGHAPEHFAGHHVAGFDSEFLRLSFHPRREVALVCAYAPGEGGLQPLIGVIFQSLQRGLAI